MHIEKKNQKFPLQNIISIKFITEKWVNTIQKFRGKKYIIIKPITLSFRLEFKTCIQVVFRICCPCANYYRHPEKICNLSFFKQNFRY